MTYMGLKLEEENDTLIIITAITLGRGKERINLMKTIS